MPNAEYWKKRFEALEDETYKKSQKYIEDMMKQFQQAQNDISMDIERWYQRLADNNEVSLAAARKLLEENELEEFHWNVEKYIEIGKRNAVNPVWMKELENASARIHIQRLEAMRLQMQQHAELLYTKYHNGITEHLRESYSDRFYRTAFEIQKGIGVGSNLSVLDTREIDKVLTTPWATDEKNFSTRIWNNKGKLVNELHRELTQSLIKGDDPQKAINNLARNLNTSKINAGRLVMTETAAISSAAQNDCFKELDVEEFEIVATLDNHTSEICQHMDGQHFPLSQYEVGVTAPPFHVWCRSTTVPYFDDEFTEGEKRAARDAEGDTYYVPANMTYPEWKKLFVDGDTEARDRFGLITNNNKSNPKYYDFLGKDLKTIEQEISQNDYETAVIFDNGKAISCQIGNEDTIKFTKYQLKRMKGRDVTHNHPLSTPPSPEDLYLLVNYKVKSFRTCGKNGTYVLEYNEQIEKLPDYETFSNAYDEIIYELRDKYYAAVKNGMNKEDAIILLGEAAWERLYELYNVKPRFEGW